jgi:AcrR family transcriptional regulator
VFQKGFSGARMQEIADEAGINKAMLHYCFKTNNFFEAVFMTFNQLSPQINALLILMHPFLKNNKVHLRLHHIRHRQSVFTAVCNSGNE